MAGTISDQADDFSPPTVGEITVLATAAGVASVVQDTGITGTGTMPNQMLSIGMDQVYYISFSKDGTSVTLTDPVISSVAGDSRTMGPFPPGIISLRVDKRRRYFKLISAVAGTMRWYLSSGTRQI